MSHRARLLLIGENSSIQQEFPVDRPSVLLGRTTQSTISLQYGEISRIHAQIVRRSEGFFVRDMGSTNGTYLNGRRLKEQQFVKLCSNDKIILGGVSLIFQIVPVSVPVVQGSPAMPAAQTRRLVPALASTKGATTGYSREVLPSEADQELPVTPRSNQANRAEWDLGAIDLSDPCLSEEELDLAREFYDRKLKFKSRLLKSLKERLQSYAEGSAKGDMPALLKKKFLALPPAQEIPFKEVYPRESAAEATTTPTAQEVFEAANSYYRRAEEQGPASFEDPETAYAQTYCDLLESEEEQILSQYFEQISFAEGETENWSEDQLSHFDLSQLPTLAKLWLEDGQQRLRELLNTRLLPISAVLASVVGGTFLYLRYGAVFG